MRSVWMMLLCVCIVGKIAAQEQPRVHFNHAALFVIDLSATRHFYSDVIGLDTLQEPFKDGKHIWYTIGVHNQLHIIAGATTAKEYYKNQHLCFSVPDFNAFVEKLKTLHLKYEDVKGSVGAVTVRVDGIHQLWLQDPDGYWVEINDDRY